MNDNPADRRRHPRVSFQARAKNWEGGELFILDVSESGVSFLADLEPKVSVIDLELNLAGSLHECRCKVVWCKKVAHSGKFQVGLHFEHVTPSLAGALERRTPTLGGKDRGALRDLAEDELERLELLACISGILNESYDSDELMARVMEVVVHYLHAERGLLIVPQGEAFRVSITAGGEDTSFSSRVVQQVICSLEPLLSLDAADDVRLEDSQSLKLMGTRSILCLPIVAAQRCLGLIYLDNSITTNAFNQPELHLARIIADMAASAMERADFMGFLRQSQRDLATAHAELHSLVERNPDGILMVSLERKVLFSNPSAEHFLDIHTFAGGLALKDPNPDCEVDIRRLNGELGRAEVKIESATWGEEPAYLVTLNDVTEQRQKEEQLRHSQRMQAIGRLAGGLAHDFNNLLTAILGSAELLEVSSKVNLRERETIRVCAERAASLTRQLLTFSKKRLRKPSVLDLSETVRRVQTTLLRVLGEDIKLQLHGQGIPLPILADEDEIGQILLNFALNSREAMPGGGSIYVQTSQVERRGKIFACLKVRDNGSGIEESIRHRIFEPFFTTKAQGTGLGLATVYGIVESCQGQVSVQSVAGQGTVFTVLFPCVNLAPEVSGSDSPNPEARESQRILLVEDEPSVREFLGRALVKLGYQADAYGSAEEALAAETDLENFSLVLSDVMLPGLSGLELAELLVHRKPSLKVLLISGYSEEILNSRSNKRHGQAFLHKPFGISELASTLKALLSQEKRL